MTSVAVVGHVEWVEFLLAERLPRSGELVHARREPPRAAGSAVIAAIVMAEQGGDVHFIGAVGADSEGDAAVAQLESYGVAVSVARRPGPTRRAFVLADGAGERSIVTAGDRWAPAADDALDWDAVTAADGVYLTAGDEAVLSLARRARVLVATPRVAVDCAVVSEPLDALVFSANDPEERELTRTLDDATRLLVGTEGAAGGRWWGSSEGRWVASEPPGAVRDTYGGGDAFAGGFTLGLARGLPVAEAAALGARCGARMLTRVGAP